MAESHAELKELVRKYQEGIGPQEGEKSPGFQLLARGKVAVPIVLEAFHTAPWDIRSQGKHSILRLADLLAEFGDPRATSALIHLAQIGTEFTFERSLLLLIPKLERRGDAACIAALVEILKEFRFARPRIALLVAEELVALAERNPVQELAAALPLLRCGLFDPAAPLEFGPLRKRLKTALNLTSFPLVSSAPKSVENLPLPTEQRDSDD
jgi:hypothetical protein